MHYALHRLHFLATFLISFQMTPHRRPHHLSLYWPHYLASLSSSSWAARALSLSWEDIILSARKAWEALAVFAIEHVVDPVSTLLSESAVNQSCHGACGSFHAATSHGLMMEIASYDHLMIVVSVRTSQRVHCT